MKALDFIERVGNRLPDPIILFFILAGIIIIISAIVAQFDVVVDDPAHPGETLTVMSLLSKEGIAYIFESAVKNFTGFAPLGTVLVTMLGIGLAERSGLIGTALRALVEAVPEKLITLTLVFGGVMSSMASDAGYVVLVPLGGAVYASLGRNPLAGIAAAFAGVSGGYSANLFLTSLDPLLAGITQSAAEIIDAQYAANMNVAMNYYFMVVSVFLVTIVGTVVTEVIVAPRLGEYKGQAEEEFHDLQSNERRALRYAGWSFLITIVLLSLLVVPSWGPLRGEGSIIDAPFFQNLVPVILIMFLVPGIVYGKIVGTIQTSKDVAKQLSGTMASMGSYIVLAFAAGQFVAYFSQTKLGLVIAVKGADLLQRAGFKGMFLIIAFILLAASTNLFIGSASAKWVIMAPVFVPIMMKFGYSPELTQVVYRVADSSTNIISPLMSYFAMVIAFSQKYDKSMGLGTLITTMLPYSVALLVCWTVVLFVWIFFGWDLGPGSPVFYP